MINPTEMPSKNLPITIYQIPKHIVKADPVMINKSTAINDFHPPKVAEKLANSDPRKAPMETDPVIREV